MSLKPRVAPSRMRVEGLTRKVDDALRDLEHLAQRPGDHRAACQDAAADVQWALIALRRACRALGGKI